LTRELNAIEAAVAGDARLASLLETRRLAASRTASDDDDSSSSSSSVSSNSSSNNGGGSHSNARGGGSRSMRSAVATLMLVLFSFGALFNAGLAPRDALSGGSGGAASGNARTTGRALLAAADVGSRGSVLTNESAWPARAAPSSPSAAATSAAASAAAAAAAAAALPDSAALRRLAAQFEQARPSLAPLLELVPPSLLHHHQHQQQQQQSPEAPIQPLQSAVPPLPQQQRRHNTQQQQQQQQQQLDDDEKERDELPALVLADEKTTSERREEADKSGAALVEWSERRASSGPVENATYWFTPNVRALRRGNDPNLLGLMLPITAFDSRYAASHASPDDVPVLELICEVKSVMRTPFFASSFLDSQPE
jgi:hypothetical protein